MSAEIISFPKQLAVTPPKTERQKRFDRMVELLMARAARKENPCTEEKARAALTQAILSIRA
ncbi:MAG: hypothetical protein IAE66_06235 [Xanthomonadaceae bacterium]|nr:hypothetical protein [Xanthomonadaceae bacterium]